MNQLAALFALCSFLSFGTGCGNPAKIRQPSVADAHTRLKSVEVSQIAEAAAVRAGVTLMDYDRQKPRFKPASGEWTVYFESRILEPGGHFWILVNDSTGVVELVKGL